MISGKPRLSTTQINNLFVASLGPDVTIVGSTSDKPLLVNLHIPFEVRLRAYLYNCTNPPGGRTSDEYKSQIIVPGQARGTRGNFVFADNRIVLLGAYARLTDDNDSGVFVFWDPMYHVNFAYSANIQVKSEILVRAIAEPISFGKKSNGETIVACQPEHLVEAIKARIATVSFS